MADTIRESQLCNEVVAKEQPATEAVPFTHPCRPGGGLSPCITMRKSNASSSKANATWSQGLSQPRAKPMRVENDLLGLSLHSARDALTHHENDPVKPSSSKSLQHKKTSLKDDPEVTKLLKLLQTTDFVGKIDPIHHSRYIAVPPEEESNFTVSSLFDLSEMHHSSISIMTNYNSDEHLHSPMQASQRALEL
jgi:hypothetical protein